MLNKVMLIGRLGADPEVRYMPSGGAVTTIRLARPDAGKISNRASAGKKPNGIGWCFIIVWLKSPGNI